MMMRPDAIPVAWLGQKARRIIADAIADRDAELDSLREHLTKSQEELALGAALNNAMRQEFAAAKEEAQQAQAQLAAARQELTVAVDRLQEISDVLSQARFTPPGTAKPLCAECKVALPQHARRCVLGRLAAIVSPE